MKKVQLNLSKIKVARLAAKQKATQTLWRRGEFSDMLLNEYQLDMLKAFDDCENIMSFLLCSRRIGKTWVLSTAALRQCYMHPGSRVLFLSTTTDQATEICDQTFELLLDSCPADIRPEFKVKTNKFIFQNGSEIRVKGLDKVGGAAIRGVKAHLVIFDEACFMKGLSNILDSVVMPMVIATGGKILFGSTPPDTPGHDSIDIINRCAIHNALTKRDIYTAENILYSPAQILEFERQAGGKTTSTFRREYLCEIVTDSELAVLPAFTDEKAEEITMESEWPKFVPDKYVSMDIGWRDFTAILFGYWDYARAVLVIQDEILIKKNQATTERIAREVMEKEQELWPDFTPKRFCDTDPRVIHDLYRLSGLKFVPTKKDNKEAQINQTNIMVVNNQIEINPRCTALITQMRNAVWNKARTQFQRTSAMGHFDMVDALLYMVRNIKRNKNPIKAPTHDETKMIMHDWGKQLNEDKSSGSVLSKVFSWRK